MWLRSRNRSPWAPCFGRSVGAFFVALASMAAPPGASVLSAQAGGPEERIPVTPIDPEAAPRPVLSAFHTSDPISIDGRIDEAVWFLADSAAGFITTLPRQGYPATERTVVRVLFDDRYLYIGAVMFDSAPELLVSPGLEQDFETHDADMFGVSIDSYLDRQTGTMFGVSPAGAVFDAQMFNDSRNINRAWEGVVHVQTRIEADRWTAEIAVPFTTLRFDPSRADQEWGINFLRRVRRINEDSYWAPLARQFRLHKMSRAGTLVGLRDLRQGRNLTVKPYLSAASLDGSLRTDLGETGGDFDAGLDLKYGVTPRLTLDVTALTDFSQVEVDQEQVNLTRFSLFFPEKRDFFLENDGIFTLGDVTERNTRTGSSPRDFKLFYSRSIGLSPDRRPIPIAGGARLSGRVGDTELGFLSMQTRTSGDYAAENFAVARVRQAFGSTGDLGVMLINRQGTTEGGDGEFNRSVGVDANLNLFRYMLVNAYVAATHEPDVTGDRTSGFFQVAWRDNLWDASAFLKHVGESFNPSVGFIRRTNMRQGFATVGAHPQFDVPHLAELNPYVDLSYIENLDGEIESRSLKPGLAASFIDGGVLTLEYEEAFERLYEETAIAGASVAPGDYSFHDASLRYMSSGARALSGTIGLSRGDFYDGDKTSISVNAVFRPSPHVSLDVFAERNDLTLGGDDFTANVFGGRVRLAWSTSLFGSAFVQYNEAADELITNLRVNLIHAPLSDVFLVFTERRDLETDTVLDRVVTLKVTKLFAF